MSTLDHYENQLGRAYSWMVGDRRCRSTPSVQLAAGALSISRLLAYTRTGNLPISRPFAGSLMRGRKSWPRRQKWFDDYIQAIKARDMRIP